MIRFDPPFFYDTARGNLLFDWDLTDGFPAPAHLSDAFDQHTDQDQRGVRFGMPVEAKTGFFVPGFVQQFTFVPDCNADGIFDVFDLNCIEPEMLDVNLEILGLMQGDADGNGEVEFADFVALSENFGASGQYTDGDFDKSGDVQFADFVILSNHFGLTVSNAAIVPEPSAISLALLGIFVVLVKRTRN